MTPLAYLFAVVALLALGAIGMWLWRSRADAAARADAAKQTEAVAVVAAEQVHAVEVAKADAVRDAAVEADPVDVANAIIGGGA